MTTPAELGLSHTSSLNSMLSGTSPNSRPSRRMYAHLRSLSQATWSDGPMWMSSGAMSKLSWLVTAFVLLIFFDSRRSRSSMFLKSMLPPTLSCMVRSSITPRSSKSLASTRWTMVAPTWLLMSSPTMGIPALANRAAHDGVRAMNTGTQLTTAHPASMAAFM